MLYPFEIHITVDDLDPMFQEHTSKIGVKAITLDLNSNLKDQMTSSKFFGSYEEVQVEVQRIHRGLEFYGYQVIRTKIETVPWHPDAMISSEPRLNKKYLEAHLGIRCDLNRIKELQTITDAYGIHMSRNVFKNFGKYFVIMATLRDSNCSPEEFNDDVQDIVRTLQEHDFELEKVQQEFVIFDSNVTHDDLWLEGKNEITI